MSWTLLKEVGAISPTYANPKRLPLRVLCTYTCSKSCVVSPGSVVGNCGVSNPSFEHRNLFLSKYADNLINTGYGLNSGC